ncbi:MAG TPA: cell division protein FtsQ/DivIB [Gammaproteobacteria bacterium]|nr:cell division protein FtsQ/DivIB [Gammaproteobacteria bacterium]
MEVPRKSRFKRSSISRYIPLKKFLVGFSLGLFVVLLASSIYLLSSLKLFPIRYVEVVGNHEHVPHVEIYEVMQPGLLKGFFGLSVNRLRKELCSLPWIKHAIVRRVWPNKVLIKIVEHEPLAVWNNQAILTKNGALITPKNVSLVESVPYFFGPEGKYHQIIAEWRKMGETLAKIDLNITHLELAPRGAWQLTLDNGITVRLGTHDIQSRLDRFVRAYDKVLFKQEKTIEYVDLRYTIGLAIGWKPSSIHNS